jgi:GNAT superfamily N-acetyltransferase
MLIPVPAAERQRLRPLFRGTPGLHGCLEAGLNGDFGEAFTDDLDRPTVGLLVLDFYFPGGDPSAPAAPSAVHSMKTPATVVVSDDAWVPLLQETFHGRVRPHERVDFLPGAWDRARLEGFLQLEAGYRMERVTAYSAQQFSELAPSLVYNFRSLADFIERGVGFGVIHHDRFVSGCSSFTLSGGKLEFEIQTHPEFRRRGLALACAARMVLHCIDNGIEPCWDAHNEPSALLAKKLGFVEKRRYKSWLIDRPRAEVVRV